MQVTKEGIERIKSANELSAVVAERGIELKKKGRVLVARCVFHEERTASFTITPAKGLYHCFGCGAAGDVIGFVTKHDKVSFGRALEILAQRAGLDLKALMEDRPRNLRLVPAEALAAPPAPTKPAASTSGNGHGVPAGVVLTHVVEHYHKTFCEREDAQAYLKQRGLLDRDLLRALKVGYADGSLLKMLPKEGELRDQVRALGVVTPEGRELMGGCIVVPIPDPVTGAWTNLYGRGLRTPRHCYLPGPLRGVLNFQAARLSPEVILTESVLDGLSFLEAGVSTAIPIYGTNGFTADHLDTLKRERVTRVILALDNDEPGRKATDSIKEKLSAAGITVRVARFPEGIKDANDLLVSKDGDAGEIFRQVLDAAEPRPELPPPTTTTSTSPLTEKPSDRIALSRDGLSYHARAYPASLGRLRATVKVEKGSLFHVDTLDLYASRSRAEYAKRASKVFTVEASAVEAALLALLVEAEKADEEKPEEKAPRPTISQNERAEALELLRRADLLDRVARDIDALGYVGEETNKRLLYLVAISRKLPDPLSAVILSQSGAGKSGLTEVIERLCPPEDVVLFTRLTPQSLYYTEPGYLDRKLVIVEERYGSADADYSIRVLQSRKKLIAAAPIKDPQTGNMRTKTFVVEARAAFIEATTAASVNHENATRCFELAMDESAEQTKRIHDRMSLLRTGRGLALRQEAERISRRHWNAQRLLETLPVVIPFADRLSFPSAWLRTRRDYARFLNLIEVSAFLHQHQRERQGGAIVASTADYGVAYALAGEVLAETLSDLRKPLREALERVRGLCATGDGTVSRREIREALSVPDSTVRRWLSDLVELEYLTQVEAGSKGAGRTSRYRLEPLETHRNMPLGLLRPEDLEETATRQKPPERHDDF
jgi:DNA primase